MPAIPSSILALDVGDKRVGVAIASLEARLPRPLAALTRDDSFVSRLRTIIDTEHVSRLVIGWPRGLEGQATKQTATVEAFVTELKRQFELPIVMQDEALTSKIAEAELQARGKAYEKGEVDALAATYILDDFLKAEREQVAS